MQVDLESQEEVMIAAYMLSNICIGRRAVDMNMLDWENVVLETDSSSALLCCRVCLETVDADGCAILVGIFPLL